MSSISNIKETIIIQKAWRQHKLNQWINLNRSDFISHAVWRDNVASVFASGWVKPAEQTLRERHCVSFEKGDWCGMRGSITIPKPEELPLSIIERIQRLPPLLEFNPQAPADCLFTFDRDRSEKRDAIAGVYFHRSRHLLEIFYDMLLPKEKRVDTLLALQYETLQADYKREGEPEKARLKATQECRRNRQLPFGIEKLSHVVWANQNSIDWRYGEVVVLRGKGSSVIGQCRVESQVMLLAPFQNKGEFFGLDLAQKETIILAPKRIADTYRTKKSKYRIFAIENLTKKQRQFFEIYIDLSFFA